jgi:cation diffusion facilitator CzcD-associated flavoprotein CzcO
LLIVGAGPFGLAVAAYARAHDIAHMVIGRPMSFWREHMPPGMILRSAADWSLDPQGVHTIEAFFESERIAVLERSPIALRTYLAYAEWFRLRAGIEVHPWTLLRLDTSGEGFTLATDVGTVRAANVVLAVGPRYFAHTPADLRDRVPVERLTHTCELVDMVPMAGKRCLIVGGRQSAFESAALLHEAGAACVDVVHRHPTPAFAAADWDWATAMMARAGDRPDWYRTLPAAEQDAIVQRMWAEGRLKVEPWLEARLRHPSVRIRPGRTVAAVELARDGVLTVLLDDNTELSVDEVIAATGYQTDLRRIPFLQDGNVLEQLSVRDGSPVLDAGFQTSVPGLFATGALAGRDFGPFMNFTLSAASSAQILGRVAAQRLAESVLPSRTAGGGG